MSHIAISYLYATARVIANANKAKTYLEKKYKKDTKLIFQLQSL